MLRDMFRDSAFLVLVNIASEDWSYTVDERHKVIGRSPRSDIRIPDRFNRTSRKHAEIWRDSQGVWLRDLKSSGGTRVNDVWLKPLQPVQIAIEDRLHLADLELKVVNEVSQLAAVVAETGMAIDPGENIRVSGTELNRALEVAAVRVKLQLLTPAELDIVLWVCRGIVTDEELGEVLCRSPHTVRTQMGSIFSKLELHSRTDLVGWIRRVTNKPAPPTGTGRSTVRERKASPSRKK